MSAAMDNVGNLIMFGNSLDGGYIKIVIRRDGTLFQQVLNQAEYDRAQAQALTGDRGHTLAPSPEQVQALSTHFGIHVAGRRPSAT